MKDKYDEHIEAILTDPDPARKISQDWNNFGPLFEALGPSRWNSIECGCPTQVKRALHVDPNYKRSHHGAMDEEVRKSKLIPVDPTNIRPDRPMLEEFARIQRLADKVYNRPV